MTLDKHTIQGLSAFTTKTLRRGKFETRMIDAGLPGNKAELLSAACKIFEYKRTNFK